MTFPYITPYCTILLSQAQKKKREKEEKKNFFFFPKEVTEQHDI